MLVQEQIRGNIKAPRYWPLWGEFTDPAQRTSNTGNLPIWWSHHRRGWWWGQSTISVPVILWNIFQPGVPATRSGYKSCLKQEELKDIHFFNEWIRCTLCKALINDPLCHNTSRHVLQIPGFLGSCTTRNFTNLARSSLPTDSLYGFSQSSLSKLVIYVIFSQICPRARKFSEPRVRGAEN